MALEVHIQATHAPVEDEHVSNEELHEEPVEAAGGQRHLSEYKCNFCEFVSSSIDQIWNHKLDKHTGQSFNFNNFDKNDRKDFLFHMLADQNNDLLEEVMNMKKAMKDIIGQMMDDFENGLKEFMDETRKQNKETIKVLSNLQQKMKNIKTKSPRIAPKAPSGSPTSNTSSPNPSKADPAAPKATKSKPTMPTKVRKEKAQSEYQLKPKVLLVGDSIAHNTNFRIVEEVTHSTI